MKMPEMPPLPATWLGSMEQPHYTADQMHEYALAYAALVREECAKEAASHDKARQTPTYWNEACQEIASAIRKEE